MELNQKGMSRADQVRGRAERIANAARLYSEILARTPGALKKDVYAEIGKQMNLHPITVMQLVHTAARRSADYDVPQTFVKVGPVINNERYLTPMEAAKLLGVARQTLGNWIKQQIGPKYSVVKIEGKDNLLYKWSDVVAWRATTDPIIDGRGRHHYYNNEGKLYPKRTNGSGIKSEEVGSVGKAMIETERKVRMGRKDVPVSKAMKTLGAHEVDMPAVTTERAEQIAQKAVSAQKAVKKIEKRAKSKSQVKRVAAQAGLKFDDKVIQKDGHIHGLADAAKYVGVHLPTFTAAYYGRLAGYGPFKREGYIKHKVELGVLAFDPADLRDWRVNVWKGLSEVSRSEGAKLGWASRKKKAKPKVAAPEPKKRSKRTPRFQYSKEDCLQEMRTIMDKVRRGSLTRKRWFRLSNTGRRYEDFYTGRNAFHRFMMDALNKAPKMAASIPEEKPDHAEAIRRDITEAVREHLRLEAERNERLRQQQQPERAQAPVGPHVEMLHRAIPNVRRPWWKLWK